jgi:acetoin:2,6-dichlorophenolindophenol oxidoreductase subunit alpha
MEIKNDADALDPRVLISLCRTMVLIRKFEEKIVSVYSEQNMKSPIHICIGQEAIAAGVCAHLRREDYLFSTHRNHGYCLAKGVAPRDLLAEFYGRKTGCCNGKGGSMHPASPEHSILGTSAIVGGGIPLAVGAALASWLRNDGRISAALFGDGASEEGTFHESMNFASLKKLPVIFVCENNFYATNSPLSARQPSDNIAKRADSYGMPGLQVDGNNVVEVFSAVREAVQRARNGNGSSLIECRTYRWKGHVGPDCDYEKGCRPRQEFEDWQRRCPVTTYKKFLREKKLITDNEFDTMQYEIDSELELAVKYAKESPLPSKDELFSGLYFART